MCSLKIFSKNWWFSLTAEVTPGQLCHCASKMAVSWLGAGPRWGQDIPTAFLIGQIYGKMMKSPWGLPDTQGEWSESVVMICDDHNWWGFNQLDEGFRVVIHHDIFIWIFRAFKVGSCSNLIQPDLTWYIPMAVDQDFSRPMIYMTGEKNGRKLIEFIDPSYPTDRRRERARPSRAREKVREIWDGFSQKSI